MGALLMAGATLAIFVALLWIMQWWLAGVIAVLFLSAWFFFNVKQGTAVMYGLCAKAYLMARRSGGTHNQD
jgi:hypothetical protein